MVPSSMILIEGIKKGEEADMNTIWTQIGFPNTSIALPVWVKDGENLPNVLRGKGTENCPLNAMAMELKNKCYPISRSAGYKYLNVSELINAEKQVLSRNWKVQKNTYSKKWK